MTNKKLSTLKSGHLVSSVPTGHWIIFDSALRKPYLNRTWASQADAIVAYEGLLKPYPFDNPWRARLTLEAWAGTPMPQKDFTPTTRLHTKGRHLYLVT